MENHAFVTLSLAVLNRLIGLKFWIGMERPAQLELCLAGGRGLISQPVTDGRRGDTWSLGLDLSTKPDPITGEIALSIDFRTIRWVQKSYARKGDIPWMRNDIRAYIQCGSREGNRYCRIPIEKEGGNWRRPASEFTVCGMISPMPGMCFSIQEPV